MTPWLLTLTLMFAAIPREGADGNSCLDARGRCHDDSYCKTLLDRLHQVCDLEDKDCMVDQPDECQSVRLLLRTIPYFKSCTCDAIEGASEREICNEVHDLVFVEDCAADEYDPSENGSTVSLSTGSRVLGHGLHLSEEALEKFHRKRLKTCIAIRKRCLLDQTCSRLLEDFWAHCREKKRTGVCISDDRDRCFKTIEEMKPWGMFDCHCRESMKNQEAKEKCMRIHYRITQNVCLVSVPYFIYSMNRYEMPYEDLVAIVTVPEEVSTNEGAENTCVRAFINCKRNPTCRPRLSAFMTACHWDKSAHQCARTTCLQQIKQFYLMVRPEQTHALLFCRCYHGDRKCEAVRESMKPTCIKVDDPSPSCSDVIERCSGDTDCRIRLEAIEKYCSASDVDGTCVHGKAICRNARVGIMGTVLTLNCTCDLEPEANRNSCLAVQQQLLFDNSCTKLAADDLHLEYTHSTDLWADASVSSTHQDCLTQLSQKTVSFITKPAVIRVYDNESDCSDLCQCLPNGTVACKRLPCSPNYACKDEHNAVFAHDMPFEREKERGLCRCIRAEIVCAKTKYRMTPVPGFFMHVGYSINDQFLIEGNSGVKVHASRISEKLGILMNKDSLEWEKCRLDLHLKTEGNMIFRIIFSPVVTGTVSTGEEPQMRDDFQACSNQAKELKDMINIRHPAIVSDAELSILKVAQLERIQFHVPATASEEMLAVASRAHVLGVSRVVAILTLLLHFISLRFHLDFTRFACDT